MGNRKMSFRHKLLVAMLVTALVPILIFVASTYVLIEKNVLDKGIEAKYDKYENQISKVVNKYESKEIILKSIEANYPLIKQWLYNMDERNNIEAYLNKQKNISNDFFSIYITMQNGYQYNSESLISDKDTRLRYWYIKSMADNDLIWTDPYKDVFTGDLVITAAIPIRNLLGDSIGVIGADIEFEETLSEIENIKILPMGKTYIVNKYWKPISEISDEDNLKIQQIQKEFESEKFNYKTIELEKEYVVAYEDLEFNNWQIISIVDRHEFVKMLFPMISTYGIIGICVMMLIYIFTRNIAQTITNPLRKLEFISKQVIIGNYDQKIEINTNDEFERLAETFNEMLRRVNESKENMEIKNKELFEMNEQLQDMNIELEASLEQLTATMSLLDNSEEKYKTLMENMYDIVFLVDKKGEISFVNQQFMNVFKYKASQIIGKSVNEFIKSFNLVGKYTSKELVKNIMTKDIQDFDIAVKSDNGDLICFEANTKLIYKYGKVISSQVVLKDVTERQKAEAYLHNRNRELRVVNRISSRINSTLQEDELYGGVAKDLINMMDINTCSIRLIDGDFLELKAFESKVTGWDLENKILINNPMLSKVTTKGEIMAVKDFEKDNIFGMFNKTNKEIFKKHNINEIIYIPLNDRYKINGMITISGEKNIEDTVGNVVTSISKQLSMMIENIKLYDKQKTQYLNTIQALVAAEEAKDKYTEGHSIRVAAYSVLIAKDMELEENKIQDIEAGAILHDIGKIGISDKVLNKTGKLTDEEYEEIQKHPEIGYKILNNIDFSKSILNGVLYHHKRYDLKGYPKEAIEEIPIEAAIIGVADAFDAMTSSRSYRQAMSIEEAIIELNKHREKQFDPAVVDVFLNALYNNREGIKEIMEEK